MSGPDPKPITPEWGPGLAIAEKLPGDSNMYTWLNTEIDEGTEHT